MKHIYIIYTLTPWILQPERYMRVTFFRLYFGQKSALLKEFSIQFRAFQPSGPEK